MSYLKSKVLLLDIEADGLDPSVVWVVVCKSLSAGKTYVFNDPHSESERKKLQELIDEHEHIVAHYGIEYDFRVLSNLLKIEVPFYKIVDTVVVSKLLKPDREGGHSLEAWGKRLGVLKTEFNDFSKWTQELSDYCVQDVNVLEAVFKYLFKIIDRNPGVFDEAIRTEQHSQYVAGLMHRNGFRFDIEGARKIYQEVSEQLEPLLKKISETFPPKIKITQLKTKVKEEVIPFNPGSPKQVVERMWELGWKPKAKTKSHLEAEKNRDKEKLEKFKVYGWKINEENLATLPEDAPEGARLLVKYTLLSARLRTLTEWIKAYNPETGRIHGEFDPLGTATHRMSHSKPNMGNIATKKTIKYNTPELRELAVHYGGLMRSLWICDDDAWLDRWNFETCLMNENITLSIIKDGLNTKDSRQQSIEKLRGTDVLNLSTRSLLKTLIECLNSKNINVSYVQEKDKNLLSIIVTTPNESEDFCVDSVIRSLDGMKIGESLLKHTSKDLFKQEVYLCGTDMEGAHLRIFAHLINDPDFTKALIEGKKENGTDPHSKNKGILGAICVDRDRAKTFIFSYLNGASAPKVSEIFGCSLKLAKEALDTFVRAYPGLALLKSNAIPRDAERGYFIGVDGRYVLCDSEHLMMGMLLQNAEATLMKRANRMWMEELDQLKIRYKQVNFVHDEWVTEVYGDKDTAILVGKIQSDCIRKVGEMYGLRCPLAGESKIGKNWLQVH